jgi:hypothetical protein
MHPILNIFKKLLGFVAVVVFYCFLIMIIWNKVIVKKFPNSNIQQLTYWDSVLLSVFVSVVSTGIFSSFYKDETYTSSQGDDYGDE